MFQLWFKNNKTEILLPPLKNAASADYFRTEIYIPSGLLTSKTNLWALSAIAHLNHQKPRMLALVRKSYNIIIAPKLILSSMKLPVHKTYCQRWDYCFEVAILWARPNIKFHNIHIKFSAVHPSQYKE